MKKVVEKQKKYKSIEDGYLEKVKFVTEDGKEFTSEKDAEKYESQLEEDKKFNAIKSCNSRGYDFPDIDVYNWYKPETEDELNIIKNKFGVGKHYHYVSGELKVGEWISCEYNDGGDYHDTYDIYTLTYLKEEIKTYFSMFNE